MPPYFCIYTEHLVLRPLAGINSIVYFCLPLSNTQPTYTDTDPFVAYLFHRHVNSLDEFMEQSYKFSSISNSYLTQVVIFVSVKVTLTPPVHHVSSCC